MAAPSNTVWGDIVKDYDRVGISISQSYTDTQCTVTAEVWFWTKYSLTSNNAKTYFEFDTTAVSSTASGTKTPIKTTYNSGSGWSTTNQILLGTYTKVYNRTANVFTQNCAVKINGLSNTSSNVTATTSYTVDSRSKLILTLNTTEGVKSFTGAGQYPYGGTAQATVTAEDGYHLVKIVSTSWDGTKDETWSDMAGLKEFNLSFYMEVDRTATAYAERDTYIVSYNANGGDNAPTQQTKFYGIDLTLSSIIPTRDGYKFLGWGTSATDTSADYSARGSYTSNSSITLYAIWKKTITLSYNANGGSGAPSNQSGDVYNSTSSYEFTISTTAPTRTGYKFLGWSTSSTATSATYSAGDNITLSQNTKLYAVWEMLEMLGTLRIKQNGVWKSGLVWIKDNGEWRRGVAHKKVKGTWKRGQ